MIDVIHEGTRYTLTPARSDWLRRLLWPVVPYDFWMTYRLPFQKRARITHPGYNTDEAWQSPVLEHERIHAEQFGHWWGPWLIPLLAVLLPLPILFSGRWLIERPAYLADIKANRCTVDEAVQTLWQSYGFCWPRPLMRAWFLRQLGNPKV